MEKVHYEMMEVGCLAFMAIYQLVLFFLVKKKYYLYLALICVTILIRSSLIDNGSQLMLTIFPSIGFAIGKKIEFLAAYSNIVLLPLFIHDIFRISVFKKYIKVFIYIGIAWLVFILVTPFQVYKSLDIIFQCVLIADFLLVFRMLFLAWKFKKTGAGFISIGIFCGFIFVLIEMLRVSNIIDFNLAGPNLINTGVVIFLFFLTIALSSIFAESFNENIKLNTQLNERVLDRTRALSESNLVKDHIIRTISHDLRSPLANLQSLIMLSTMDNQADQKLNENYIKIKKGIGYSLNMLDDLLAWASSNRPGETIKVYTEKINLQEIVFQKIMKLQEGAVEKNISILNKIEENLEIYSDRNVLKVVLRNLLTNAIKFTNENGQIVIESKAEGNKIHLMVCDNGIGIPDGMKKTIFEMNPKNKRPGTAMEKSTGIGLAIVKDLMDQIKGEILVEDNPTGNGAVFKLILPNASSPS